MNNLTWLYESDEYVNSFAKLMAQVGGHATDSEQAEEWLLAERNDGLAPENGVSDADGGSNDGETASDSVGEQSDSREKLEADMMEYYTHTTSTAMWPDSANIKTKWISVPMDKVCGWLDRQAAIAKHDGFLSGRASLDDEFNEMQNVVDKLYADLEAAHAKNRSLKAHIGKMQDGRHVWHERAEKLQEQVDELTAERDNLAPDLAECERDRDVYRMALGDARRLAHEIARIEAGDAS